MQSTHSTSSSKRRRAGQIVSALAVLFLVFDGVMKLLEIGPVLDACERMGLPAELVRGIGILLLACVALYVIPKTSPLGAVLLTGYLGGAVVLHLRIGDPLASHTLFPVYVGALLWGGLLARDARLASLLVAWSGSRDELVASAGGRSEIQ
jgi:hypothetical protein